MYEVLVALRNAYINNTRNVISVFYRELEINRGRSVRLGGLEVSAPPHDHFDQLI